MDEASVIRQEWTTRPAAAANAAPLTATAWSIGAVRGRFPSAAGSLISCVCTSAPKAETTRTQPSSPQWMTCPSRRTPARWARSSRPSSTPHDAVAVGGIEERHAGGRRRHQVAADDRAATLPACDPERRETAPTACAVLASMAGPFSACARFEAAANMAQNDGDDGEAERIHDGRLTRAAHLRDDKANSPVAPAAQRSAFEGAATGRSSAELRPHAPVRKSPAAAAQICAHDADGLLPL